MIHTVFDLYILFKVVFVFSKSFLLSKNFFKHKTCLTLLNKCCSQKKLFFQLSVTHSCPHLLLWFLRISYYNLALKTYCLILLNKKLISKLLTQVLILLILPGRRQRKNQLFDSRGSGRHPQVPEARGRHGGVFFNLPVRRGNCVDVRREKAGVQRRQ